MKIIQVPTSQGGFGNNKNCFLTPSILAPNSEKANIIENNLEQTNQNLENIKITEKGELFIGGDHSITYSLFKGFKQQIKQQNPNAKIGLLILDAHADCSDNFMPPTHEDFNRVLIEQKIIDPKNLLIIGCTKVYDNEKEFIQKHNLQIQEYNNIHFHKIKEFIDNHNIIYLSIDIDILSQIYAPGTHYPDGKLTLDELTNILTLIKSSKIKRADLVEINPTLDQDNKTLEAGKKIIDMLSSHSS
jgi:arginase family enzyme